MSEPASKAERTKERILEAALELLPGALRSGLEQALGPVPVSRRAGVSRQTWYRYWGGEGDSFMSDFVSFMLPISWGMAGVLREGVAGLTDGGRIIGLDAAVELARLSISASYDAEYVLTRFIVFMLATEERAIADRSGRPLEEGVTALVREHYDRYTDELAEAYGAILDAWGREPAPPFDLRSIAVVLTALASGLSIRHAVDPEAAPLDLGKEVIIMLAPALTRVKPGSSARGPSQLFGPEQHAAGEPESAQRLAGQRRVAQSRSAIISAARREFILNRYENVSMASIAEAAGVSETTLYEHFYNKPGVARACFEDEYKEMAAAIELDTGDLISRIRRHIERLAVLLTTRPALTVAVLDAMAQPGDVGSPSGPSDPRAVVPLPFPLLRPIRDAKAAGLMRDDIRTMDLAIAITNLVVVHSRLNPDTPPDEVARHVDRVVLQGVLTDEARRS